MIKNKYWKLVSLGFIFVFLMAAVLVSIDITRNNSQTIANFADNVLRPIIGNTATIQLETVFYNAHDYIQQVGLHKSLVIPAQENNAIQVVPVVKWDSVLESPKAGNAPIIQTSTYYPDNARNYAYVHLVKIDTHQVDIDAVAGKKEPASEVGNPGSGIIPEDVQISNRLIAAFNGGFQYRDGQYGMIAQRKTYLPLREGLATFFIGSDSSVAIQQYQSGIDINRYRVIRQNGEMLIKDGVVIPSSKDKLAKEWGRSVTSNMYTWRSGIGVTSEGELVYAVGPSLIPQTLGIALQAAGAVNAMQIDMNPYWVRFVVFKPTGNGQYTHQSLFPSMYDGGRDFLNGYQKDFFYVSIKPDVLESNHVPSWKITTHHVKEHKKSV